jgi:peptidoglycan/xylan/chitin deacetylase (PgdA/CDA1 family)
MIFKKHPKLKLFLKKCLEFATFYRIRYHAPFWSGENAVFTFDDGPFPQTAEILDVLDKLKIKAVFFLVAENVKKYPEMTREIAQRGHLLGSHGLIHENMKKLPLSEFSRQTKESLNMIKKTCGVETKFFRPPFGQINLFQAIWLLIHGFTLFFWSCAASESGKIDSKDSSSRMILLLHDYISLDVIESVLKNEIIQ